MLRSVTVGLDGSAESRAAEWAAREAADEHRREPSGVASATTPFRPVILGLGVERPGDALIEPFDASIDELLRGEVTARIVIDPGTGR
ncbi:hypothetical protein ABZ446_29765 [Streptomyces sp. NPDC005813]|uniref:hypothetical protein n=1 Tax=Streptomyces sp. NPDC005813 TaxID=3155592 RepID=UPI0033CD2F70